MLKTFMKRAFLIGFIGGGGEITKHTSTIKMKMDYKKWRQVWIFWVSSSCFIPKCTLKHEGGSLMRKNKVYINFEILEFYESSLKT